MNCGNGDGGWRKSSHSTTSACVEVKFTKSSYSGENGCVEVALDPGSTRPEFKDGERIAAQVRDSKDTDGSVLSFTAVEWDAFLAGVRDGEFDLPHLLTEETDPPAPVGLTERA